MFSKWIHKVILVDLSVYSASFGMVVVGFVFVFLFFFELVIQVLIIKSQFP